MISISTSTYDLDGTVVLNELPDSTLDAMGRRVQRVKTLDGGVAVNDGGFAHGDRTLTVRWRITDEAQLRAVQYLVQSYATLIVTTRDGAFSCAPQKVEARSGKGRLDLLIVEALHA